MTLPSWSREPLVHFLALGLLVYLALTWGGTPVDPASRIIEVGAKEQAQLSLAFERQMGRPPTDAELDTRIEQFVRDEVLYREALRLGFDQGDAVVRQRMVTKMDLSASAAAELAEPDEDELRAYFAANQARYSDQAAISFEQAFFNNRTSALAGLERLNNGGKAGEAISLPATMADQRLNAVRGQFGDQFMSELARLDPGEQWQGPIPSGFGWHNVRLTSREAVAGDFDAMRERVVNDWRSDQIEARRTRAYEILRDAYRIEIDR